MGALISELTGKIRAIVPESAGRWSDAALAVLIHQAEMIVGEQTDADWTSTDIALVAGALYYPLPKNFIGVGAVTFAANGTDFIDQTLFPCTVRDLDEANYKWRDQGSTRPTHYSLIGAPGSESSRILLWPKLATVTTEAVRVHHLMSYSSWDLSGIVELIQRTVQPWIQDAVYMPIVLGLMYATIDPNRANLYFRQAFDAMPDVRANFVSPYSGGTPTAVDSWSFRAGGQLR